MLNIQDYQRYSGEKKIALMDNSTVSFLEQVERAGISTKELLKDYDAILIPNWVSEEICDSIYRKDYIEFTPQPPRNFRSDSSQEGKPTSG